MKTLGEVIMLIDLVGALSIAAIYRILLHRSTITNWRKVLNYGSDLYELSRKGNLNHVWYLLNPGQVFERVYTVCSNPKSPDIAVGKEWLVPVLIPKWRTLAVFWLLRLCRKEGIGLLRSRGPDEPAFICLCLKIALGIPMILSTGGNHRLSEDLQGNYPFGNRRVAFFIEEMAYRYGDLVFCINQYTQKLIENLGGGKRNKLVLNPIRIDESIFTYERYDGEFNRSKEGIDRNTKVVLFVGRLEFDKQVDIFLDSIPIVLSEVPAVIFYIVGDGSLRWELEKRVNQWGGLSQKVVFKGFLANEELPHYYCMADVVCIPMSGFVIYEAAAMQRPIVAFDVDWHGEFVKDGITGLLIPNRDTRKLAQGIISLLRDEKLAKELAQNARREFIEKYDPETLGKREARVIERFCQSLNSRKL